MGAWNSALLIPFSCLFKKFHEYGVRGTWSLQLVNPTARWEFRRNSYWNRSRFRSSINTIASDIAYFEPPQHLMTLSICSEII
jgi:hypothetical protein